MLCCVADCKSESVAKSGGMCQRHKDCLRRRGTTDLSVIKDRAPRSLEPWVCLTCKKEWLANRKERRTKYCSKECQTQGLGSNQELTAEKLRLMMSYDPETGLFTRLIRTSNSVQLGDAYGVVSKSLGYVEGCLLGRHYRAHRLAFLYMTGEWPKNEVDHINGDKADNRWVNLRDVPPAGNAQNKRRANSASKTGVLGVWRGRGGRFVSQLKVDGARISVGTFDTIEEASAAYIAAKRRHHECNTL